MSNNIIFSSKADADRVLEAMNDIIKNYKLVSLGDLYSLVGLPSTYEDDKKGWTSLNNIAIRKVEDGYVIDLPVTEAI